MERIGIICEYNPFHNGHLYHIKKIKELYPDSLIILVLNGYFLERGEVSIETKETKTKLAIENGIDIVLELPFVFGSESADTFANTAIKILNNFKVKKIVFGSECNDIEKIKTIALKELDNSFDLKVKELLDEGINYPTALAKALDIDFSFTPNDLLGISYVKAILQNKFDIDPITIKRTNDYHDLKSNEEIISASNIRNKINNLEKIDNYLPYNPDGKLEKVNENTLFTILKAKILTTDNLESFLDVDEGIEYRLKEKILTSKDLNEFIESIKTKRYTYNKIKRMLIHILIGLKKEDVKTDLDYIKILGFNTIGQNYLQEIKKDLVIPTVVNKNSLIYNYELKAAIIYDLICNTNTYGFEVANKPIKKD